MVHYNHDRKKGSICSGLLVPTIGRKTDRHSGVLRQGNRDICVAERAQFYKNSCSRGWTGHGDETGQIAY